MRSPIRMIDGRLPRCSPEEEGLSSADIAEFFRDLEARRFDLHSAQIVRRGRLLLAAAAAPFTLDSPHRGYSATKGIIAAAVLFAVQEGKLGFDDKVASFFEADLPAKLDERYRRLSLYHMLTMQVGQASDEAFLRIIFEDPDGDLIRGFFETPMSDEPGTRFFYNNAVPQMLCFIVERATGIRFEDYLQSRLCSSLGAEVVVQYSNGGHYEPSTSVLSSNSFLRFALFFLQEGAWEGRQLLDAELIRSAGALHVPTLAPQGGYGNGKGYGLQLWRNAYGGYRFDGGRGQYAIVLPDEELAAVFMSNELESAVLLDIFYERVVSRMRRRPLPASEAGSAALEAALGRFTLAPLGLSADGSARSSIQGKSFSFEGNELGIESLRFDGAEGGVARLSARVGGEDQSLRCGLGGEWAPNEAPFIYAPEMSHSNAIYTMDPNRVLASGGWEDGSVFSFKLRSLAWLGEYLVRCDFSGGGLSLSLPRRVSIGKASLEGALRLDASRAG